MRNIEIYEHKGFRIREIKMDSISDALKMKQWYLLESDVWLKKLCAKRLLEYGHFDELKINKEKLLESMQCQINL
jgi:hypothetical protein